MIQREFIKLQKEMFNLPELQQIQLFIGLRNRLFSKEDINKLTKFNFKKK